METNKFYNKENVKKLEGEQVTDNALEMGSPESSLDSNLENEYNKISEIAENSEITLAKLKEAQAEIEEIEGSHNYVEKSINKIREDELGLSHKEVDIPSLTPTKNKLAGLKDFVLKTTKALVMSGIMLAGTSEATAQTNKTLDKNPEKTEVKTEVSSFYDRLQEYNIIPSSMTAIEFQKKAEDQDQSWFKSVTDQYRKARGIMSVEDAAEWNKNNPNAKVIEKTQYVYDTRSELEIQEDLAKKAETTEENKTKALEEVWKKQKKGQYKIGDTVNLVYEDADGNKIETKYVVKIYPKEKKDNKSNSNSDSKSSIVTNTKFVKDRLGN